MVHRGSFGGGEVHDVVAQEPRKGYNSRLREVNRAAKAVLANQKSRTKTKTKRGNTVEEGGGEREGKRRRGARNNSVSE